MNSTLAGWLQVGLLVAALAACYIPLGNYTARNYAQTTAFMIWLNRNHTRLIIRQIIGANEKWVYPNTPGYYNRKTLNDHKDHVHIGWGYWP